MSQVVSAPIDPARVGVLYDRLAELDTEGVGGSLHVGYWEPGADDEPLPQAADRLTAMMADRLGVGPGARVLDVGCGMGQPCRLVSARTGAHVTGVSISETQVERAAANSAAHGTADLQEFLHADAMDLPFPDGSFDAAVAIESIFHMPDRERVLGEIHRVLRPGGTLVLTDFFERAPIPERHRDAVDRVLRDFIMTMVRVDDYPPMLRRTGLRLVELVDITERSVPQTFSQMAAMAGDGPDVSEAFDSSERPFGPADLVGVDEFGCLLLTARRPSA